MVLKSDSVDCGPLAEKSTVSCQSKHENRSRVALTSQTLHLRMRFRLLQLQDSEQYLAELAAASKVVQVLLKTNDVGPTNGKDSGHRWTLIAARADLLVASVVAGLLRSKRTARAALRRIPDQKHGQGTATG